MLRILDAKKWRTVKMQKTSRGEKSKGRSVVNKPKDN